MSVRRGFFLKPASDQQNFAPVLQIPSTQPVTSNQKTEIVKKPIVKEKRTVILENGSIRSSKIDPEYQKVTIDFLLSKPKTKEVQGTTLLIIAADKSGSMSGAAWRQVQQSLCYMVEQSNQNPRLKLKLITYNHAAGYVSPSQYYILKEEANGLTSFPSAYRAIMDSISAERNVDQIVVVFMTDGENTHNQEILAKTQNELKKCLGTQSIPATVHSIGFGKDHKYDVLNEIRRYGNTEGVFRYADLSEGIEQLKTKFVEVFDFAVSETKTSVKVDTGSVLELVSGTPEVDADLDDVSKENYRGSAEFWVRNSKNDNNDGTLVVGVEIEGEKFQVPLVNQTVEDKKELAKWNLEVMEAASLDLNRRMMLAHEQKKSLKQFSSELESLQKRFLDVNPFSLAKDDREEFFQKKGEIQKDIDILHSLLSDEMRGTTNTASIAKANDIRFTGKLKKQRHQRTLDMRAARNANDMENVDVQLESIFSDKIDLEMSEDALEFFYCMLSSLNIEELITDASSKTDIMGFGLAVVRPEHAIDEATTMRVDTISNTIVTQSALQSSIKYGIDVQRKFDAHGGFDTNELSFTLTGRGREPINAFLPLYIHEQHWNRVKLLLKPALGYFVTLDPLGYAPGQLDVPFMILGAMVLRLSAKPSEQQLRILFAHWRTCMEIARDFDCASNFIPKLTAFINSASGRTKDKIANLSTVIGWILCTDPKAISPLQFGKDFRAVLLQEVLRRACRYPFQDTSESVILGLADIIVHGENDEKTMTNEEALEKMLSSASNDNSIASNSNGSIDDVEFDPTRNLVEPELERPNMTMQRKEDKHMVQLARFHLGKMSQNETKEYERKLKSESTNNNNSGILKKEVPKPTEYISEGVSASTIRIMKRLETQILKASAPPVTAFCNAFRILDVLFLLDITTDAIDKNNGLAPNEWIEAIKKDRELCFYEKLSITEAFSTLGVPIDFNIVRAAILQALFLKSNTSATAAANQGRYLNPVTDAIKILTSFHDNIDQRIQGAQEAMMLLAEGKRVVMYALGTPDLLAFAGYMLKLFKENDRNDVFRIMCTLMQNAGKGEIPEIVEKLKIMLTGRYEDKHVIGKGNAWIPEGPSKERFVQAIGEDEFLNIEVSLRGRYQIHVYRESDSPNRHGHCNSNPYIPPEYRHLFPDRYRK